MDFPTDFFRDEVRNGFYVPTAIKQLWAACLTVLGEIDRICEKHHITYFADWGTILGAVRHGGFVPWDDDLDICMKRDDYVKFRQVADRELPAEYVIHDYERKEDHWLFLSRVVNQSYICFDEAHLQKYHNFPYMIGVDIFLQDYLYEDEEQEKARCEEVKRLIAVADGIVEHTMQKATVERELAQIGQAYGVVLDPGQDARSLGIALYRLAEKQMARVPREQSNKVGQIFPWILKGVKGLEKEMYEKTVRLPFENTTIPVPAYYNRILQSRYGNYLEIHKVWNGHDYPFFEAQRENLRKVADFDLPEFTFAPEMLERKEPEAGGSLKDLARECIEQLEQMTREASRLLEASGMPGSGTPDGTGDAASGDADTFRGEECLDPQGQDAAGTAEEVLSLLPDCQQLSVDYATLVEKVRGTERKSTQRVTESVQAYCDALYEIFLFLTEKGGKVSGDSSGKLMQAFSVLKETARAQILERGELLFLPIGPVEWNGLAACYEAALREDRYDISVVPLPVLLKDPLGRIRADGDTIAAAVKAGEYPQELPLADWASYDLGLHHPDRIYIQNPYDGENPCLSVPPQFYARNLQPYTEELVYLPAFRTDEFGEEDYNDLYNLKHYVTAPGVIYADRVVVQSEQTRGHYVERLTAFAGEETREHWERVICVEETGKTDENLNPEENMDPETQTPLRRRKQMLYCIGLNELSEFRDQITDSVKSRMEIFRENSDRIGVTVCLYPADTAEWMKTDAGKAREVLELLHAYEAEEWYEALELKKEWFDDVTDRHDAYYGSPSPLVPLFVHEKKPVMISDYGVSE